jgi:hypothetical protein
MSASLREKARHARRLARAITDQQAADALEQYAEELEMEAGALEASQAEQTGVGLTILRQTRGPGNKHERCSSAASQEPTR